MTKAKTILLAVLAAAVAGVLYKFVPDLRELAATFASLAVGLVGWTLQHPADKPQPPVQIDDTPTKPIKPEAA